MRLPKKNWRIMIISIYIYTCFYCICRPFWNSNFDSCSRYIFTKKHMTVTSPRTLPEVWCFGVLENLEDLKSQRSWISDRNSITKIACWWFRNLAKHQLRWVVEIPLFTTRFLYIPGASLGFLYHISHNIEFGSVTFKVIPAWLRNAFLFEVDLSAIFTMI